MLDMRPELTDDSWLDWPDASLANADLPVSDASDRGFDHLPVGVFLAAGLSDVDFGRLSAADRVEAVSALQRLVSHYQAQLYAGVASIYEYLEDDFDGDVEMATGATAAEVRAALRLTRRSADLTVDLALALATRLPAIHQALLSGAIDVARTKTIVSGTEHLTEEAAQQVVRQVLADAPRLTTGQLAARLRRLCLEVDPDQAAERLELATQQRRVELRPDPAGTGHVFAFDLDPVAHLRPSAAWTGWPAPSKRRRTTERWTNSGPTCSWTSYATALTARTRPAPAPPTSPSTWRP